MDTQYPDINNLLKELLSRQQKILGDKLVGLYLYGSLVWGDFNYEISDIDLLAALSDDLDERETEALQKMHEQLAREFKVWDNRIEVQYSSLRGLKSCRIKPTKMGNINPGEPFHITDAGKDCLVNWYFVQDFGKTLYGPDPHTVIDHISKEEFIQAIKEHALQWQEYIKNTRFSRNAQAYAIVTLCRAFYTYKNGTPVSKNKAALWAEKEFPEWAWLIKDAIKWRQEPWTHIENHEATYPETERFVEYVINQIK